MDSMVLQRNPLTKNIMINDEMTTPNDAPVEGDAPAQDAPVTDAPAEGEAAA